MIDFPRTRRRMRELPLIPLIDVVFILIIFFMLTTNFMKIESMELLLPGNNKAVTKESKDVAHVFLRNNGELAFGQRTIDEAELKQLMTQILKDNPGQRIMLLTEDKVSMQRLVEIMDLIYLTGGKSLFVKDLPPAVAR